APTLVRSVPLTTPVMKSVVAFTAPIKLLVLPALKSGIVPAVKPTVPVRTTLPAQVLLPAWLTSAPCGRAPLLPKARALGRAGVGGWEKAVPGGGGGVARTVVPACNWSVAPLCTVTAPPPTAAAKPSPTPF